MLMQPIRNNAARVQTARDRTVPAPVGGLDKSSPLANMAADRATELTNWFPQPGWVEVRRGYQYHSWHLGSGAKTVSGVDDGTDVFTSASHGLVNGDAVKFHAVTTLPAGLSAVRTYYIVNRNASDFQVSKTVGGAVLDVTSAGSGTITVYKINEPTVESLMAWHGPGATQVMFAAAGGSLWNVAANSAAVFSTGNGFSSNRWQHVNFTTSAGNWLFLVNGDDAPRYYGAAGWVVPTITGITATDAIQIAVHKKRIWFVMRDSTKAAYLGTEAVAGSAAVFELGSVFDKGGRLTAMTTWTLDGGNGPDDYAVFMSSRGQVAIYSGTDPSSASTWALVGVFDMAEPIGRRCFVRFGTRPLLLTRQGLLQMDLQFKEDKANLSATAVTRNISEGINDDARSYGDNFGWEAIVYPRGTRLLVNVPTAETSVARQYVQNTLTGAWCQFTGHNANCWCVFNDRLYFGGNDGFVFQADSGSTDIGASISATMQTSYNAYGSGGQKQFVMLQALVTSTTANRPQLGISTDFRETNELSVLPNVSSGGAKWDVAKWDQAKWVSSDREQNDWATASALGVWGSIKCVATTGDDAGASLWGVSKWGEAEWGSDGTVDQTMRINGFVVVYKSGTYI